MRVTLIRHGMTAGNRLHRYIGRTDEPLCPEGEKAVRDCGASPTVSEVYVTPLERTQETARILFPTAEQKVVDGLREMDFGAFENHSADEMVDDGAYREWVDGMCQAPCPRGESLGGFKRRVCCAFERVIADLLECDATDAVFIVHGGTIMTILERYARPEMGYYDYLPKNCGGVSGTIVSGEDMAGTDLSSATGSSDSAGVPFTLEDIIMFDHPVI